MSDLLEQLRTALGATYRISHELAGGGMSRVFEAEDLELRRRIVIKVLPPELAAAVSADRFRREIQLAASPCATWWGEAKAAVSGTAVSDPP